MSHPQHEPGLDEHYMSMSSPTDGARPRSCFLPSPSSSTCPDEPRRSSFVLASPSEGAEYANSHEFAALFEDKEVRHVDCSCYLLPVIVYMEYKLKMFR